MRYVRLRDKDERPVWGKYDGQAVNLLDRAPWLDEANQLKKISFDPENLLAPVQPEKIVALAANYEGASGRNHEDDEPIVFIKPASSIIGPNETIISPFPGMKVWGESELAIVIGKKVSKADSNKAKEAIFGYTLANDVTAENILSRDHHLARSKAADSFCPIGPWIETAFTPCDQVIQGWHNKLLLREGLLNQRVIKDIEIVIFLSQWMTLEPGDIILTGTPPRIRERVFFQDGDTYTCRLDGLGTLTNKFHQV